MKPLATPVLGGMVSSLLHVLIVTPVIFYWMRRGELGLPRAASKGRELRAEGKSDASWRIVAASLVSSSPAVGWVLWKSRRPSSVQAMSNAEGHPDDRSGDSTSSFDAQGGGTPAGSQRVRGRVQVGQDGRARRCRDRSSEAKCRCQACRCRAASRVPHVRHAGAIHRNRPLRHVGHLENERCNGTDPRAGLRAVRRERAMRTSFAGGAVVSCLSSSPCAWRRSAGRRRSDRRSGRIDDREATAMGLRRSRGCARRAAESMRRAGSGSKPGCGRTLGVGGAARER